MDQRDRAALNDAKPPPWTPDEDATLARLWHDGLVARAIAVRLGRGLPAVHKRRRALRLPPRQQAARVSLARALGHSR
jgi:hypothetical protein